jgi:hypothetical protein
VLTGAATSVGQESATLNATVSPEDAEVSDCHFEYGATEAYGSSVTCSPAPGSGGSPVAVSAPIAGLTRGASYHFRVVATNTVGTSRGTDATFTTGVGPPTVTRLSPKKGHAAGGTSVAISGTNFSDVLSVRFGGNGAQAFTVNSPTSITAVSPPGARGRVDVVVVTGAGSSPISRKDRFRYGR